MPYADPEKRREHQAWHSMTAWLKRATCGVGRTPAGWPALLKADPCAYCGRDGGTIDHIVPDSQGGESNWTNYTGACQSCNSSKHTVPLLAFLLIRPIAEQQVALERQRQEFLRLAPGRGGVVDPKPTVIGPRLRARAS